MEWNKILEGWRNNLFPPKELKELIKTTKEERLEICKNCPFNSTHGKITGFSKCKSCGCPLQSKSACLSCQCPEDKWGAVTTKEEHQEITNYINQEK